MHRFKYYKYDIINYNIVDDYYIVLDKDTTVYMILDLVIFTLRNILIILRLMIGSIIY